MAARVPNTKNTTLFTSMDMYSEKQEFGQMQIRPPSSPWIYTMESLN